MQVHKLGGRDEWAAFSRETKKRDERDKERDARLFPTRLTDEQMALAKHSREVICFDCDRRYWRITRNLWSCPHCGSNVTAQLSRRQRESHSIVSKAIRTGALTRKPCEICGAVRVEAHHRDYRKPLEVNWLCRKHHANVWSIPHLTPISESYH